MNKEALLRLYPDYTSVLGPYERGDGRYHVVLNNNNLPTGTKGKTKTISYPKAQMEIHLGRRLFPNETVDHLDRNFRNNVVTNYNVLDRGKHSSLDALRLKIEDAKCVECGNTFTPTHKQIGKKAEGKAGPFCSRRCTGRYGKGVQETKKRISRDKVEYSYYRLDKSS